MLYHELDKVIRLAMNRGIREGLRYLRGQIYSTSSYHVVRHTMESIPDVKIALDHLRVLETNDQSPAFIEEISRVYPPELGCRESQKISRMLQQHASNGALCFVLRHEDRLVGAFWVSRPNRYYANLRIPYLSSEYITQNLFIAQAYRGIGAGKLLFSKGLRMASQRGISSVWGIVKVTNTASVRTHISVGFQIIGLYIEQRRWFQCSQLFLAANNKDKNQC